METFYNILAITIVIVIILLVCFLYSYYSAHKEYDNLKNFQEFMGRDKKEVIWSQTKKNTIGYFTISIIFIVILLIFGWCTNGCFSSHGNGYREMQYKEWRQNNPNAKIIMSTMTLRSNIQIICLMKVLISIQKE